MKIGIFPPVLESIIYQTIVALISTAYTAVIAFWSELIRAVFQKQANRKLAKKVCFLCRRSPLIVVITINLTIIWVVSLFIFMYF